MTLFVIQLKYILFSFNIYEIERKIKVEKAENMTNVIVEWQKYGTFLLVGNSEHDTHE